MRQALIHTTLVTLGLTVFALPAMGQKPVYLCNGTYTDQPCAGGREVDIRPTEGAHSMSGTRKQSQEAAIRDITGNMEKARENGVQQGMAITRCYQLRQERIRLDADHSGGRLESRRLAIRQEQFKLGCSQT